MSHKVRLTVQFLDKRTGEVREVSGTYPAICAHSRIEWATKQDNYVNHRLEVAQ